LPPNKLFFDFKSVGVVIAAAAFSQPDKLPAYRTLRKRASLRVRAPRTSYGSPHSARRLRGTSVVFLKSIPARFTPGVL